MEPEVSISFLKEALNGFLHSGVVTVTFIKESTGLQREMVCTLDAQFLPPKSESEEGVTPKKARAKNPDICVVYDLESKGWRSFRYDSITSFKIIEGVYHVREERCKVLDFTPTAS